MNRITRRSLGILAGLALGWYAAGLMPGLDQSMAQHDTRQEAASGHDDHTDQDHGSHQAAPAQTDQGHSEDTHAADSNAHSQTHGDHNEPIESASLLVPGPGQVPWYRSVLGIIAGLFIAAVVIGVPALKLRGPEPPDPAAAADSHGH